MHNLNLQKIYALQNHEVQPIGVTEHFFDLGGYSLLTITHNL